MHTEKQMQDIVNKYCNCMQEIKYRIEAIKSIFEHKTTTLYPQTNTEFICLQIRKVLELIALANLVANNDEYEKIRKNFTTDWNAKRIIETIKKVNPEYFPKPIYRQESDDEKISCKWKDKNKNILDENLYISIYDETSCILHSKNPFDSTHFDIDDINIKMLENLKIIVNTLNEHNTTLCNKNIVNCVMHAVDPNSTSKNGFVSVHYFQQVQDIK